jgi:uncharacterized protein YdeI (YjbR/CyaY-like superfamily)
MDKENNNIKYFTDRKAWRTWLEENHNRELEIWLIYPHRTSGKPRILYNDAVEEALCFGWIDSQLKNLNAGNSMQRFTPRKRGSSYSQANRERLKWLHEKDLLHPSIREEVEKVLHEKFVFPPDILDAIRQDPMVWKNYQQLSGSYKRIRIAYIDGARKRPEEFKKRLCNFIDKTRSNQLIKGHGGIEKYY